jgi:phosphoribosylanthranilate isomerase
VEARLQRLTVGLRLTADQQVKVRAILEKRQAQALQIHSTQALSAVDQFRKYQALDKQTVESIRSVLTEQQRLKYQPPHAHGPAPAGGQPPRAAPH